MVVQCPALVGEQPLSSLIFAGVHLPGQDFGPPRSGAAWYWAHSSIPLSPLTACFSSSLELGMRSVLLMHVTGVGCMALCGPWAALALLRRRTP